ncbi:uncharacterized protein NECHADRAFT_74999 [Fusarium vanettenii 77-13-4]|uniref:Nudix hydrolase domain-containing protein n=1 Tax=Fusarium vanettenii (strain ATCC MYA-4622 / CBS 123669 / FGSC 9596 / NRRL 45880 / 77-13-4) TaxID=660122 RepID=C7YHK3_FUSV7|nr:uncharacterized protein NECHADRAFT_74999 [Fusarium vanettenii 77-13-4]EEU47925.1 hypothetical protein NECHADRAFT_74999 [Fusarium vanettenii 77-13-4]
MASTRLAKPSGEATQSSCLNHSAAELIYPGTPSHSLDMTSLYGVVQQGNKIDAVDLEKVWAFYIQGIDEVVGYMRDDVQRDMIWDENFTMNQDTRTILLNPKIQSGENIATACCRVFSNLCLLNRGRFNNCIDGWLAKDVPRREFQPLHVADSTRQDLTIPLPIRGLFGVVTVGVHLNVYTVKQVDGRESVDRIWVSHRAKGVNVSYSGMLDQVVAGGMDPTDRVSGVLSPCVTLKREAREEAGLHIDLNTREVLMGQEDSTRRLVGSVEQAPAITFYDCKDRNAGLMNEGHLEPGVRFVYDLRVDTTFQPHAEERGIERFEALSVDEVKKSLHSLEWKPNCGLVMVDFMVRKGLVSEADDTRLGDIMTGLQRPLPFKFAQDKFRVLDGW